MEKLLSRKEAAELLGVSPATLAVWQSTGRYALPCVKCGSLARYKVGDLEAFIESRKSGEAKEARA